MFRYIRVNLLRRSFCCVAPLALPIPIFTMFQRRCIAEVETNSDSEDIDESDVHVAIDSGDHMEHQLADISGTFRADVLAFIVNEAPNKSLSEIGTALFTKYPGAIAEAAFIVGGTVFSALAYYKGRQKLRSAWLNRNFYNTINVSLNSFDINPQRSSSATSPSFLSSISFNARVILHTEIEEIIPNAEGARYLRRAAMSQVQSHRVGYLQRLCGAEDKALDPILRLHHSTHFICYRLLRNVVSGVCAPWFIARDIQKPLVGVDNVRDSIQAHKYIMAVCVEEEIWSKIHVVLTRRDKLQFLIDNMDVIQSQLAEQQSTLGTDDWSLLLTEHKQADAWTVMRWNTVVQIAREYKKQIEDGESSAMDFAVVELIAPTFDGIIENAFIATSGLR